MLTFGISRRLGFTLVEMLVVIAIIGILAGLLLPTLGRAKDKAKGVACLSNVKQWGLGIHLYVDDNHEIFPYEGSPGDPINASFNVDAWYNVVPPLAKMQPLMNMYAAGTPPLPFSRNIFTCPSVREGPPIPPTVAKPFFMYGFNNRMDPNGAAQFRLSQVTRPVETVIFTENSENEFPSTSGIHTPARHSGRANLAFVDGHAEAVREADFRRTPTEDPDANGSAGPAFNEWGSPAAPRSRKVYWYPFWNAPQ